MDRIREQLNRPVVAAIAGAIVGLIIGLIFAWQIWPVKWVNGSPANLGVDYKQQWLEMTIQSYAQNKDAQLALQRFEALDGTPEERAELLSTVTADPNLDSEQLALFQQLLVGSGVLSQPQVTAAPGEQATEAAGAPVTAEEPAGPNLVVWVVVLCLLLLVIGGIAFYLLVVRKRPGGATIFPASRPVSEPGAPPLEQTDYVAEGQEPPIAQFMTTYVLGEDAYDDSFSIDSPTGEFLGECGVGISDTIGVGDPKKVTAFEVWLFDKNDIQTVTKVLMSEHAYNDPNISQRLMSKGEPVVVEPGQHILLETATLRLEARVVDMNYGQGALPQNSYFDRMTLELAIWQKME